jgi:peptide/nickel transport system ATP-binding protein
MSIIFISHDLSLVSAIAHRVVVMYQGEIVEQGEVKQIFKNPHNYKLYLFASRPSLDFRLKRLPTIQDFLEDSINTEVVTQEDRTRFHDKLYSQTPILEVINVENIFYSRFLWKKSGFKAVNDVSFKCMREKHRFGRGEWLW